MNPRILLVEDDPTTRTFLSTAIAALPASVDAVDSASAARLQVAAHDYVLWLIDAHLPDGSGIDLLATLRAEGLRTPAVAHTAAREPALRDALLQAGFCAVWNKPITGPGLQGAVRDALDAIARARPPRIAEPRPGGDADAPPSAEGEATAEDLPVWDDAHALAALGGQQGHVDALRDLFRSELPAARAAVDAAVRDGDRAALHATLHRLQASCGFVGAARLGAAASALQSAAAPADRLPGFLAASDATLDRGTAAH